jgi:hypothetical protein
MNYARGPGSKLRKTAALDLALEVVSVVTATHCPGMCWSVMELADVCGVHWSAIQRIEARALRKLRHRILFSESPLMRELREARV